jgi:hypothetical protein
LGKRPAARATSKPSRIRATGSRRPSSAACGWADTSRDDTLAPFRAFIQGRSDLDTLTRDAIHRARQAFEHVLHADAALDVLREGCAAQAAQARAPGKVPALGLHLLRGLVCAAQDRLDDAARACETELSEADRGQVYMRANARRMP